MGIRFRDPQRLLWKQQGRLLSKTISLCRLIVLEYFPATLWHQKGGVREGKGLVFLLKMHKFGVLTVVGGLMFNKQYGDPSTSKLLQLVVKIV